MGCTECLPRDAVIFTWFTRETFGRSCKILLRNDFFYKGTCHKRWCWFREDFIISCEWLWWFTGGLSRNVYVRHLGLREDWLCFIETLDVFRKFVSRSILLLRESCLFVRKFLHWFHEFVVFHGRYSFYPANCSWSFMFLSIFVATTEASFADCQPIFMVVLFFLKNDDFRIFQLPLRDFVPLPCESLPVVGSYGDAFRNLSPWARCMFWIALWSFSRSLRSDQDVCLLSGHLLRCWWWWCYLSNLAPGEPSYAVFVWWFLNCNMNKEHRRGLFDQTPAPNLYTYFISTTQLFLYFLLLCRLFLKLNGETRSHCDFHLCCVDIFDLLILTLLNRENTFMSKHIIYLWVL